MDQPSMDHIDLAFTDRFCLAQLLLNSFKEPSFIFLLLIDIPVDDPNHMQLLLQY